MLEPNRQVRFGCTMKARVREKLHRLAKAEGKRPGVYLETLIINAKKRKDAIRKKNPNMRRIPILPNNPDE